MSKTFLQTLAEIKAGALHDELTEKLAQVIAAVAKTSGKGRLILELDIKMAKGGQTAVVESNVKTKIPEFDRAPDFFFISRDFSLLRDHPDQQRLPLRDVNVDPDTGEIRRPPPQTVAPVREAPAAAPLREPVAAS